MDLYGLDVRVRTCVRTKKGGEGVSGQCSVEGGLCQDVSRRSLVDIQSLPVYNCHTAVEDTPPVG